MDPVTPTTFEVTGTAKIAERECGWTQYNLEDIESEGLPPLSAFWALDPVIYGSGAPQIEDGDTVTLSVTITKKEATADDSE